MHTTLIDICQVSAKYDVSLCDMIGFRTRIGVVVRVTGAIRLFGGWDCVCVCVCVFVL